MVQKMKNKIFLLFFLLFSLPVFAAPNLLDNQIVKLESRRDELKQKIEQCNQGVKKQKIAGGVAIGLAGVGVAANIKLYQKVSSIKSGGTGGTSGGGSMPSENLSTEQKDNRFCKTALGKLGDIEKVRKLDSCKDFNG